MLRGIKSARIRSYCFSLLTPREKCPYSQLLWSVFSRIRAEYGEMRSISPYSLRMWTRVTANTDTFHAELAMKTAKHLRN